MCFASGHSQVPMLSKAELIQLGHQRMCSQAALQNCWHGLAAVPCVPLLQQSVAMFGQACFRTPPMGLAAGH